MAVCSHCGREAAPFQRYCQYCGEALDTPQQSAPAAVKVATAVAYGRILVRSTSAEESGGPNGEEREYVLDGRDISIGRSPSCDVALSGDQLASRRHALLRFKNDVYTIVDLGSSNGTYVNDDEIREETTLHDGDYIKIGGHEILYSTAPASPRASLAGVRMSQPLPHTPLSETNPSIEAVELPYQPAAPEPSVPGSAEEAQPAGEPGEPGEPPISTAEAFVAAGEEEPVIALGASDAEAAQAPEAEEGASEPAREEQGVAEPASVAGEQGGDELDTLRIKLTEISTALALRAEESARLADRLHTTLVEVRDQLREALGSSFGGVEPAAAENTSELITVARQAAENPRHLDYVTRLAERAGDIADALEARPAAEPDATLRATVEGLIARLDQLLA